MHLQCQFIGYKVLNGWVKAMSHDPIFPCNLQCNAIALQAARKIASCDMALRLDFLK